MAYLALYRSYRPSTFEEVAGQQHIIKTLQKNNILKRADHVIETIEVTSGVAEPTPKKTKKRVFNYALGF